MKRIFFFCIATFFLVLFKSDYAQAQTTVDSIEIRFANPQFKEKEHRYSIDVEVRAKQPGQELFGINFRFFYDASDLEFESLKDLPVSYGIMGDSPIAHRGNEDSGKLLFNFPGAAAYVNTAIQLMNESSPLVLPTTGWVKLTTLNFSVSEGVDFHSELCPSLIWDQKIRARKISYLPGSGGLIVTLVEKNLSTRETTKPCVVVAEPFNWTRNDAKLMPYGTPVAVSCAQDMQLTSTNSVQSGLGYRLYQNYPNPFSDLTVIEFDLPISAKAKLVFSDVNGRVIHLIENDFPEGRNAVQVRRSLLGAYDDALLFYRLETDIYKSQSLRMIVSGN